MSSSDLDGYLSDSKLRKELKKLSYLQAEYTDSPQVGRLWKGVFYRTNVTK